MQVRLGGHGDVDQRVPREQRQHVIEEADAAGDARFPRSVEVGATVRSGFARLTANRGCAWHVGL